MPCLEAFRTGSLRDKSPKKSIIISFKTRPLDLLNILVAEKGTDNLDFEFTSNILALSYRGIILKARCFLLLYDVIVKNKRIAAFLDVLESLTGFGLAIFLHMHMLFVSTIHFGRNVFDGLTEFLDGYYLAHIGIPPLILIFFIHFLLAARKIPVQFKDQIMAVRHATKIKHLDSCLWLVQVITGMGILLLATIHIWVILANWPISSALSITRVSNHWYLYMYMTLVLTGLAHTYIGLYRLMIKWLGAYRKRTVTVLLCVSVITVTISFFSLYTFTHIK